MALVERREHIVTKDELLENVWPGLVVEENNLQVQISALRKLLGRDVIATIPGRPKVSRPRLSRVVGRERLFREIDEAGTSVVWIMGPPGCGKTTPVASYLDARKLPGIW